MKRFSSILPLLCIALPACDTADEPNDSVDALDLSVEDIAELDDAEIEALAANVEDPVELDEDELRRLDELDDAFDAIDLEDPGALERLSEIEYELAALMDDEYQGPQSRPDGLAFDRDPSQSLGDCFVGELQSLSARLSASLAKHYAHLARNYGAANSGACWVYAHLTHYYAQEGSVHADHMPTSATSRAYTIWTFQDVVEFANAGLVQCGISLFQSYNYYSIRAYDNIVEAETQSDQTLASAWACTPI